MAVFPVYGLLNGRDVRSPLDGKYRLGGVTLSSGDALAVHHGDGWIDGRVEHDVAEGYYFLVELGAWGGSRGASLRCPLNALERARVTCRTWT